MANIVIGSAFRNCAPGVMYYMDRVTALRDRLRGRGHELRVIAVEGDSIDNTRQALIIAAAYHRINLDLVICNHGGPMFGSTEQPERMKALSKVGNAIFESVRETDDALLYVESDLQWDAATMDTLIADAVNGGTKFDVVAPMVMAGEAFYDIWGFRWLNGERWSPFEHHTTPVGYGSPQIIEVGSVGSCLAMRGEVARQCRIRNDYCLVGWCEDARAHGYRIGVVTNLTVRQA